MRQRGMETHHHTQVRSPLHTPALHSMQPFVAAVREQCSSEVGDGSQQELYRSAPLAAAKMTVSSSDPTTSPLICILIRSSTTGTRGVDARSANETVPQPAQ